MFNPIREVPGLELCKRLKELGFPQDGGGWYWVKYSSSGSWVVDFYGIAYKVKELLQKGLIIKAPTVNELDEWLPPEINCPYKDSLSRCYLIAWKTVEGWFCGYVPHGCTLEEFKAVQVTGGDWRIKKWGETKANAYAEMVIWLKSNGYVNFDKRRKTNAIEPVEV